MMACTTSIGPGATNLVTAAATAHVNRLPVLLLPGDVFVSRAPDPVLQQIEDFHDGTVSANDAFRPVSRYFDRIVHPEQLLTALPRAIHVLTDAALCGPVTLALPQDVQTMAFDYPEAFFSPPPVRFARRCRPRRTSSPRPPRSLRAAKRPLIVAGGGVLYAQATRRAARVRRSASACRSPRRRRGKGALPWDHPLQLGAIGVTGSPAANDAGAATPISCSRSARGCRTSRPARTRCSRRRSSSRSTSTGSTRSSGAALPLRADARPRPRGAVDGARGLAVGRRRGRERRDAGEALAGRRAAPDRRAATSTLPYDGEVIGAVQRSAPDSPRHDIVVCAAGTLPGELHKLWRTSAPGRLPRRVRLLVHGLRDRRRARRQDGAARTAKSS